MTLDRSVPYAWAGSPSTPPEAMSIPYLMQAGNMDASVAAILWVLMHRRASVIIAAMPQRAGKTATLTALLDFLPPSVGRIYLRGTDERFDFVASAKPASTLLLVNELSDHLPYYLWGDEARRAFALLNDGYALAGTMHAENARDLVWQLQDDLGLDAETVGKVTAVVSLEIRRNQRSPMGEPIRRVRAINLLAEAGGEVTHTPITGWDDKSERFPIETSASKALAARLGLDAQRLDAELAARAAYLAQVVQQPGGTNPAAFRRSVLAYAGPVA